MTKKIGPKNRKNCLAKKLIAKISNPHADKIHQFQSAVIILANRNYKTEASLPRLHKTEKTLQPYYIITRNNSEIHEIFYAFLDMLNFTTTERVVNSKQRKYK